MHVPMTAFLENWDKLMGGDFLGEGPFAKKPEKGKGFLGLLAEAHDGDGIRVKRVGRESPAEAAGIREGDVLLKMNGHDLASRDDLKELLEEQAPEDKVTFEMLRDGKSETLTLRLGSRDS
jgi:serine protease Do